MATEHSSRLAKAAAILTNLGIIISLVYVGYEVRQNTQIARLQSHEASITFYQGLCQPLIDEIEDVTRLRQKANLGLESLSGEERARYEALMVGYLNLYEMNYYAYERGLMEDEVWLAWKAATLRDFRKNPGLAEFWGEGRVAYGEGFRSFIDGLLANE